jgi:membrane carboxypeptidase/penicillin-binding protein
MIPKISSVKHYSSAHDRFLKPAIVNFFEREFCGMFGPVVRENIADALIDLFNSLCPESSRLKPGQIVWNALDKRTRADSEKRRYKPVSLSLVTDDEVSMFENNCPVQLIRQNVMARMIKEAYQQGAVLSTRDLSLLLVSAGSWLSHQRIEYEKKHQTILPHTGVIHDMGTTLTHKRIIIYKHVVEKKDPSVVARETNHSQQAVDRYLKDFNRIKTLVKDNKDIDFIHHTTNIARPVIRQYLQIINNYVKER